MGEPAGSISVEEAMDMEDGQFMFTSQPLPDSEPFNLATQSLPDSQTYRFESQPLPDSDPFNLATQSIPDSQTQTYHFESQSLPESQTSEFRENIDSDPDYLPESDEDSECDEPENVKPEYYLVKKPALMKLLGNCQTAGCSLPAVAELTEKGHHPKQY